MMRVLLSVALVLGTSACDSDLVDSVEDAAMMADAGDLDAMAEDATVEDAAAEDASVEDAEPEGPEVDPEVAAICARVPGFTQACWIDEEHVTMTNETVPLRESLFPGVDRYNMNGWEWWQKWPGGHAPTYEYEEATDPGITCSVAAAMRFAAIMHDAPEGLREMLRDTTWEGRFFNWNDDFSGEASDGDATGAALWAWRDYLIKWISQTARDGSCYLPTRAMVVRAIADCQATADSAAGNIQGCTD